MVIVLTSRLAIFLFLFSGIVNAKSSSYGSNLCANDSNYHCYKVKRGDSWKNLFTNPEERDVVMRVNRTDRLHPGMRIAIPNNIKTDNNLLNYAPMSNKIDPPGNKTIIVSLSKLAFGAYNENGNLEYWGPVSGGKGYCPDIRRKCTSPIGSFAIYSKQGAGCKSTKFPVGRGGAPMPYCMFFHGGFALHGSYDVPGYNASHGCIRLFVNDAKWLNQEFTPGGKVAVIIKN
jgi:lipoprotein-anchoring transpeptidase ErfK/SrfK